MAEARGHGDDETQIGGDELVERALVVLLALAVSATVFFLLSIGLFRLMEYLARKAGKLDMTTSY